ncbi:MAG: hypothetical protein R3Y33_08895 [Clostridia bacterium]
MEEVIELAIEKLESFGFELEEGESLDFYYSEAVYKLKNLLSLDDLPENTMNLLSEMVAGIFLETKLVSSGEASGNVSSIKEGDISVSYEGGLSVSEQAKMFANPSEYKLSPFRRIVW